MGLVVVDARTAVEDLLAVRIEDDGRTCDLDVAIALAALADDGPSILALLEAEGERFVAAVRWFRPDSWAWVFGFRHLSRAIDALCRTFSQEQLRAFLERAHVTAAWLASGPPMDNHLIHFWRAALPSAVKELGRG